MRRFSGNSLRVLLAAYAGPPSGGGGGDAGTLQGQNGAYYLSRANHTGTQTAATISDFAATVATLAAASAATATYATSAGTAATASTATNAANLNSQPGSYYLSRTNHTGTQLAATISDFAAAVGALSGTIPGKLILSGAITPTTIAASPVNDYAPTGLATANVIFLSASVNVDINGIAAQENGRVLFLQNLGPNSVKLKNNNAGSIAANRFDLRADATLQAGNGGIIIYNTTTLRWYLSAIY